MFVPVQQKKMYEFVVDQIYEQTLSGHLKKGDKLPPERTLTEQLGISRTSVREALRALEVLGIVTSQQGEGNFINGDFTDALIRPVASLFVLNNGSKKDAVELLLEFECLAASLAATRMSDEELAELGSIVASMKDTEELEELLELDSNFHQIVAKSTGNILIESMLQIISYVTNVMVQEDCGDFVATPELRMKRYMAHHNIYFALKKRNPNEASQAMESHIRHVFTYALQSSKGISEAITSE